MTTEEKEQYDRSIQSLRITNEKIVHTIEQLVPVLERLHYRLDLLEEDNKKMKGILKTYNLILSN